MQNRRCSRCALPHLENANDDLVRVTSDMNCIIGIMGNNNVAQRQNEVNDSNLHSEWNFQWHAASSNTNIPQFIRFSFSWVEYMLHVDILDQQQQNGMILQVAKCTYLDGPLRLTRMWTEMIQYRLDYTLLHSVGLILGSDFHYQIHYLLRLPFAPFRSRWFAKWKRGRIYVDEDIYTPTIPRDQFPRSLLGYLFPMDGIDWSKLK